MGSVTSSDGSLLHCVSGPVLSPEPPTVNREQKSRRSQVLKKFGAAVNYDGDCLPLLVAREILAASAGPSSKKSLYNLTGDFHKK